jgi:tetratricopeptide (TPR) repeat protein
MRRRKPHPQPPPGPLSRKKRLLFTLLMMAFPVALAAILEAGLRLVGYGPDLSLFTTETIRGTPYHIMNPSVKDRYFARTPFAPSTSPDYFLVPKPKGTFRIFCLGGSTTVGYPYWYNGAFSTYLRERLRAVFPDRAIEVINLGMTATNSFTTLDIGRELFAYEPDLLIVYDGHNEFYGALGAASHESFSAPPWLSHLYLRLLRFRTVLLARDAITRVTGMVSGAQGAQPLGTMMERLARGQVIPYGSPTYWRALEAFRFNVEGLRDLSLRHGVPLILSTQVSNLRDLPPFISGENRTLEPGPRLEMNDLLNRGLQFQMEARFDSALAAFRAALAFDSLRAETHYRIGQCLDTLGRDREAEASYRLARDYDQLRFRMSSDFNAFLLSLDNGTTVRTVDMERVFRAHAPDTLIGKTLMFEHLHPVAYGYFLMAGAYASAMRESGILETPARWTVRDTLGDDRLWNTRCVTPLDEITARRRTEVLVSGWPFKDQFPTVRAIDPGDTLSALAEQMVKAQLNWVDAHARAADLYLHRRDLLSAAREYRTILSQVPLLDVTFYLRLARVLLEQGNLTELETTLKASLRVEPTILAARALGDLALNSQRPEEAAVQYRRALEFTQSVPEQLEHRTLLARALQNQGRIEEARSELLAVLKLRPDYQPAVELLTSLPPVPP